MERIDFANVDLPTVEKLVNEVFGGKDYESAVILGGLPGGMEKIDRYNLEAIRWTMKEFIEGNNLTKPVEAMTDSEYWRYFRQCAQVFPQAVAGAYSEPQDTPTVNVGVMSQQVDLAHVLFGGGD